MRSAFITGAATGIGEALVVRLQREGWQVFAAERRGRRARPAPTSTPVDPLRGGLAEILIGHAAGYTRSGDDCSCHLLQ
jgi:NAD(P)-dependent dehydrogenase (short-subunit alcohol dehydrogenase family)